MISILGQVTLVSTNNNDYKTGGNDTESINASGFFFDEFCYGSILMFAQVYDNI